MLEKITRLMVKEKIYIYPNKATQLENQQAKVMKNINKLMVAKSPKILARIKSDSFKRVRLVQKITKLVSSITIAKFDTSV